jgi:hypothetical protein
MSSILDINSMGLDFLKDYASRYFHTSKDKIHVEYRQFDEYHPFPVLLNSTSVVSKLYFFLSGFFADFDFTFNLSPSGLEPGEDYYVVAQFGVYVGEYYTFPSDFFFSSVNEFLGSISFSCLEFSVI